jgi:putative copper resistance protein D
MTTSLLLLSRALQFGSGMVLAGVVAFRWLFLLPGFAAESDDTWQKFAPLFARLNRLFIGAGGVLVLSGVGLFWAVASGMSDTSLTESLTPGTMGAVFFQTQFGTVFQWRLGLAVLMTALVVRLAWTGWQARRRCSVLEIAAGLVAAALFVSFAWTGHAAAAGGPTFVPRVAADALHLFLTAIWPTGLLPLVLFLACARRLGDAEVLAPARRVVNRFSQVSLLIVGLLAATGWVNAFFMVGSFRALFTTTYGAVLDLKLLLFAAILVVAATNRYRVVPGLEAKATSDRGAEAWPLLRRLQFLVTIELLLVIGVIVVVSVLGTTPPPQNG